MSSVSPTRTGCGKASCVWADKMTSMPSTREASLRSTSKPLWESSTTTFAPCSRAAATVRLSSASRMPNDQAGIIHRGLAIGV